ncbi:hypothetical protein B5G37_10575 [Pseudoflavonifractor sp. An85]|nr:hypothetical protein B5G37_10575 [Pseudoflavonifractor sp. An85]
MPEIFLRSQLPIDGFPCLNYQLFATFQGANRSEILGLFLVDKSPIYGLKVEKIIVDEIEYVNILKKYY